MSNLQSQLELLKNAMDVEAKKRGERVAQNPIMKNIIDVLEKFIHDKKLVCYGGTAINNILPKHAQFYNKEYEVPDYDFYSHDALKHAKRFRIHTFLSTSALHMKHKLKKTPKEVLELIKDSVSLARRFTDDVEWSPEDGTRTTPDFLCKTVELAIKCGARTINIPDTVGYTTPSEFTKIITTLKNKVPNIDKAILSVHCHNDLGMGVANSLAGVKIGGARQVECTINGLGERAGNTALEEIVMALRTRKDYFDLSVGIDATQIVPASKLVSQITGFVVQPNKAIVGANAFAHESGIHQDGVLKHAMTYEIMKPEDVGISKSTLVLGKHSGRHAFKEKLSDLGYVDVTDDVIQTAFGKFKILADKKKHIYDDDIAALVEYKNLSIQEASKIVIQKVEDLGGDGGVVVLDTHGNVAMEFNTPGMYRAHMNALGELNVKIYKTE